MASNAEVALLHDHQSGSRIGYNDHLLTEILIRLPVTSVLRFKSVSKHWQLLLSHRRFTHLYDNNNLSKSPRGLFGHSYLKWPHEPPTKSLYVPFDVENPSTPLSGARLDDYFNRSNVVIIQSCNGLLLCSAFNNDGGCEYYVFNPTTKQLAIIPSLLENIQAMALAYHQKHCVHYKVVCICDLDPTWNLFRIQVYSSDTRKWKICIKIFSTWERIFHPPVYWNGAVYFPSYNLNNNTFLYFNLDVEQLQMLPLPVDMMSFETRIAYFGESRGHLHLIFHTDREQYLLRVNVYEMLTGHSGWFVKYRIQLDGLLRDFPCLVSPYATLGDFGEMEYPYQNDFQVVDVVRGKEEENTFLVLSSNGKMIRYNVHGKNFKELYRCSNYNLHLSSFHRYIETLCSF